MLSGCSEAVLDLFLICYQAILFNFNREMIIVINFQLVSTFYNYRWCISLRKLRLLCIKMQLKRI